MNLNFDFLDFFLNGVFFIAGFLAIFVPFIAGSPTKLKRYSGQEGNSSTAPYKRYTDV